ncbi:MAG TPA: PH domain-containing protein [Candidatus Paceibacterota bacterium]|nr:PH domain-containing protein [Candidatus Paceibacterota bacterium]
MEEFRLDPGEKIIRSVRKHWFVFVLELLPFALAAWLPLYLPDLFATLSGAVANSSPATVAAFSFANPWVRLVYGFWWLALWIFAFNIFTQYYLNMWIITSNRIVYIYQHGFFSREVSSFLLIRVQDVTTEIHGLFATLFGYGDLIVQTASENSQHFRMNGIPHPATLRDIIMKQVADLHDDGKANDSNGGILRSIVNGII